MTVILCLSVLAVIISFILMVVKGKSSGLEHEGLIAYRLQRLSAVHPHAKK